MTHKIRKLLLLSIILLPLSTYAFEDAEKEAPPTTPAPYQSTQEAGVVSKKRPMPLAKNVQYNTKRYKKAPLSFNILPLNIHIDITKYLEWQDIINLARTGSGMWDIGYAMFSSYHQGHHNHTYQINWNNQSAAVQIRYLMQYVPATSPKPGLRMHIQGLIQNNDLKNFLQACRGGKIRALDLSGNKIGASGTEILAASPILKNLKILNLKGNDIGNKGIKRLLYSNALRNLTELHLAKNNIEDEKIAWYLMDLENQDVLPNLKVLNLYANNIGDHFVSILAQSKTIKKLEVLNLGYNNIEDRGLIAIARSQVFENLKELFLDVTDGHGLSKGDGPQNTGIEAIAQSPYLQNLEILTLGSFHVGHEESELFVRSRTFKNMRMLTWNSALFSVNALSFLGASETFKNLTILSLYNGLIGDEGVEQITNGSTLINIQELYLGVNNITDRGCQSLSTLKHLKALDLRENRISDDGVHFFVNSGRFEFLTTLRLGSDMNDYYFDGVINGNAAEDEPAHIISPEGVQALVQSRNFPNLTELTLAECVDDTAAVDLASSDNLRNLKRLDLRKVHGGWNLFHMSYNGIKVIAQSRNFPQLESLRVDHLKFTEQENAMIQHCLKENYSKLDDASFMPFS